MYRDVKIVKIISTYFMEPPTFITLFKNTPRPVDLGVLPKFRGNFLC